MERSGQKVSAGGCLHACMSMNVCQECSKIICSSQANLTKTDDAQAPLGLIPHALV